MLVDTLTMDQKMKNITKQIHNLKLRNKKLKCKWFRNVNKCESGTKKIRKKWIDIIVNDKYSSGAKKQAMSNTFKELQKFD